jgi:hypothetical protein
MTLFGRLDLDTSLIGYVSMNWDPIIDKFCTGIVYTAVLSLLSEGNRGKKGWWVEGTKGGFTLLKNKSDEFMKQIESGN